MAFSTVVPKPVLVNIYMATGTIFIFNSGKLLEIFGISYFNLMAFSAINNCMFAFEWVFGFGMIEIYCRSECLLIMTRSAI
jgi:hypothetical protein